MRSLLAPSRGVVLALAFLSASVSPLVRFWVLPLLALLMGAISRWTPSLAKLATVRFIGLATICLAAVALPRGALSLAFGAPPLRQASGAIALLGLVVAVLCVWSISRHGRANGWVWVGLGAWMVGSAILAVLADPAPWIDVFALHADAGRALESGVSPYSGRHVPNRMPSSPEGSVFGGYVYPPITLFSYALADLALGDSRWVSVMAGAVIVWGLWRISSSAVTDSLALLVVASPGWPLLVQLSWTEPLAVALLVLALVAHGRIRSVLFGMFIAAKQYLLLAAIPMVFSLYRHGKAALVLAGSAAAIAYGVGLIFGPVDYVEWAFRFHLTTPTATVGAHLTGLIHQLFGASFSIPGLVSMALAGVCGGWLATREPRSDATMLMSMTLTLAVAFMLGSQAFPNYWYLVLAAGTFAIIEAQREQAAAHKPDVESLFP